VKCLYDVPQNFIPHMAKEYGFEYELVQYKWPRWLHQQSEKQRIIWGYVPFMSTSFGINMVLTLC